MRASAESLAWAEHKEMDILSVIPSKHEAFDAVYAAKSYLDRKKMHEAIGLTGSLEEIKSKENENADEKESDKGKGRLL